MKFGNAFVWSGMIAAVVATPTTALAGHIHAGLWEITTHVDMRNMEAMIPPEQLARMKAMGVHLPGGEHSNSFQHCVTQADAARDTPPPVRKGRCTMSNVVFNAHTYSADMVCTSDTEGDRGGEGHVSVTFDGDRHYSGTSSFSAGSEGHTMNVASTFEGKWISDDCGSVQ